MQNRINSRRYRRYVKGLTTKTVPKSVKAYVKKATRATAEVRYQISVQPGTTADYNGSLVYVHGQMPQGDDNGNRESNKITPLSLDMKLTLAFAATDSFNAIRVVLFQYMVDSSIAAPLQTALTDQTQVTVLGQAWAPYGFMDPNNISDYHILYDKVHLVGGSNAATSGGLNQAQILRIKLKKLRKILYPIAANVSGVGELWMVVISDSAAVSHPAFEFSSKFTYIA